MRGRVASGGGAASDGAPPGLDGPAPADVLQVTSNVAIPRRELTWRFTTSGGPGSPFDGYDDPWCTGYRSWVDHVVERNMKQPADAPGLARTVAEAGLGAAVAARADRMSPRFGQAKYFVGFWLTLPRFKLADVRVLADRKTYEGPAYMIVVGNGPDNRRLRRLA